MATLQRHLAGRAAARPQPPPHPDAHQPARHQPAYQPALHQQA